MKKTKAILDNLNYPLLSIVFTATVLCFSLFFAILFSILEIDVMNNTQFDELTPIALFFGAVIFAPIIETLIFQFAVIEIGLRVRENWTELKIHWFIPGLLSALLFGLAHQYNWNYTLVTFLMGVILAVMYYYTRKRFGVSLAFLMCVLVHGFNNLVAFFFQISS